LPVGKAMVLPVPSWSVLQCGLAFDTGIASADYAKTSGGVMLGNIAVLGDQPLWQHAQVRRWSAIARESPFHLQHGPEWSKGAVLQVPRNGIKREAGSGSIRRPALRPQL
jgi:hypothetical protein